MSEKYNLEINTNKDIVKFQFQLGATLLKLNNHSSKISNNKNNITKLDTDIKNNDKDIKDNITNINNDIEDINNNNNLIDIDRKI